MSLEEIENLLKSLNKEDIGQKRYIMNRVLEELLVLDYESREEDMPDPDERIKKLQEFDGYMYKLAQEFLMSSSTMEKERKLEKMAEHVTKDMEEPGPEWETEKEEIEE